MNSFYVIQTDMKKVFISTSVNTSVTPRQPTRLTTTNVVDSTGGNRVVIPVWGWEQLASCSQTGIYSL